VSIEVPEGMTIESVPKDNEIPFPQQADYVSKYVPKGNVYNYGRLLIMANCFFMPNEYAALRDFYQKFNAQDQQQMVWPASFVVARAYVDQLARSRGLPTVRINAIRDALTGAERASGQARHDALSRLSTGLTTDAKTSTDQPKLQMLMAVVNDLAK